MNVEHTASIKLYLVIWLALMALLIATVAVAYVPLGVLNTPVALTIASLKAVLVILYFMHVRYQRWLIWLFAGIGFAWLVHMLIWIGSDYASRGWLLPAERASGAPGAEPVESPRTRPGKR